MGVPVSEVGTGVLSGVLVLVGVLVEVLLGVGVGDEQIVSVAEAKLATLQVAPLRENLTEV